MRTGISLIALIAILVLLLSATAVFAYNGVTGKIIDSKDFNEWQYGAEIIVFNQTDGRLIGSVDLGTNEGDFSLSYPSGDGSGDGTDQLNLCSTYGGCAPPGSFDTVVVSIAYTCDHQTSDGERSSATLSTDSTCPTTVDGTDLVDLPSPKEIEYTETSTSGPKQLGNIQTDTGPTMVTLRSAQVDSNVEPLAAHPFAAAAGIAALAAGAVTLLHRRRRS